MLGHLKDGRVLRSWLGVMHLSGESQERSSSEDLIFEKKYTFKIIMDPDYGWTSEV